MASVTFTLKLNKDLAERYEKLAESTGRTETFYMTEALADSIDRLEYEYSLRKQAEDFRAGRLKTYSLDDVGEKLGLDD